MNLWLPIMNRGIATCLNREIDPAGLSPAELRPYWLLPLCFIADLPNDVKIQVPRTELFVVESGKRESGTPLSFSVSLN